MFTMCTWMLGFTKPVLNVKLLTFLQKSFKQGNHHYYPSCQTQGCCVTRGHSHSEELGLFPALCCCQCAVHSPHHLLLEVLPCWSFPQHVLPCWTSAPVQFLLARACAFTAAVLWSHAIFVFPCLIPHPLQWENHNKSLQLEAQTYQRIQEKIQERVMNNLGTWIDWQYLQNAAKLLAKVSSGVLVGTENTHQSAKFTTLRKGIQGLWVCGPVSLVQDTNQPKIIWKSPL